MSVTNIKVSLSMKVDKVLINPLLFTKLEQAGDLVYNYEDDSHLIFGKYKAFMDSSVGDIEFKFDCSMEDVVLSKVNNFEGEVSVTK